MARKGSRRLPALVPALAASMLAASVAPSSALADSYAPVATVGAPGSGPGQLQEPRGIAVDGQGNVFVAEAASGRVQRFTPAPGGLSYRSTAVIQATDIRDPLYLHMPQAIALGPDGSIFVTDTGASEHEGFYGDLVKKYSPTGDGASAYSHAATLRAKDSRPLDNPRGVAVAPDGSVLVSDKNNHRIVRCKPKPDGSYSTCAPALGSGKPGSAFGELWFPKGIVFDEQGNLFVADTRNNRVQKLALNPDRLHLDFLTAWGREGPAPGQFSRPGDVAVDKQSNVFVVDKYNHRVQKFRPISDGTYDYSFAGSFGMQGTDASQLEEPLGLAVDSQGFVYVSDTGNSRVKKFGPDGDVDGVADVLDNCPAAPNADQADPNGNGKGAACDSSDAPAQKSQEVKADTTPPLISKVKVLYRRVKAHGERRSLLAGIRCWLSEDARVSVKIVGKRRGTRRGHGRRDRVALSIAKHGKAGANTIRLRVSQVRKAGLRGGTLRLSARDAAGNKSGTKRARF